MKNVLQHCCIVLMFFCLHANAENRQAIKPDVSKKFESSIKTESFLDDLFNRHKDSTDPAPLLVPTTMGQELQQLFSSGDCPLPDKLKAEIAKQSPYGFLPEEISKALNADGILATKPSKVPGANIQNVIYTIRLPLKPSEPSGTQTATDLILSSSDSYSNSGVDSLINTTRSSFAYTMDCSGFLNAALSVNASITVADIQSSAKLAVSKARTMFVARASVFTPVAIAIDPNLGSASMAQSNRQRMDLLSAITAETYSLDSKALDTTPITAWREMDLLWASNQGTTSMQGQGQLSGSMGGGLGVVSMNMNSSTGGSFSRSVKFSSFNTYLLKSDVTKPITESLGNIKIALTRLIGSSTASKLTITNDSTRLIAKATFFDLSSKICKSAWTVKPDSNGATSGTVSSVFSADIGCEFSFIPTGTMPYGSAITLTLTSPLASNSEQQFAIQMPILKQAP